MSNENIMMRRSIRTYTDEPVSDDDLRKLLKAGMLAPSAMNKKPWDFIIVRDNDTRKALSEICQYWQPAAAAPVVIVVCGDTRSGDECVQNYFVQDCSCASENILVAAAGLGLGSVWLGVYGDKQRMEATASLLGIPSGVYPVSVLAIGHTETELTPRDICDESKVHMEKF